MQIKLLSGPVPVGPFELVGGPNFIGRDAGCRVCLPGRQVLPHHAVVRVEQGGEAARVQIDALQPGGLGDPVGKPITSLPLRHLSRFWIGDFLLQLDDAPQRAGSGLEEMEDNLDLDTEEELDLEEEGERTQTRTSRPPLPPPRPGLPVRLGQAPDPDPPGLELSTEIDPENTDLELTLDPENTQTRTSRPPEPPPTPALPGRPSGARREPVPPASDLRSDPRSDIQGEPRSGPRSGIDDSRSTPLANPRLRSAGRAPDPARTFDPLQPPEPRPLPRTVPRAQPVAPAPDARSPAMPARPPAAPVAAPMAAPVAPAPMAAPVASAEPVAAPVAAPPAPQTPAPVSAPAPLSSPEALRPRPEPRPPDPTRAAGEARAVESRRPDPRSQPRPAPRPAPSRDDDPPASASPRESIATPRTANTPTVPTRLIPPDPEESSGGFSFILQLLAALFLVLGGWLATPVGGAFALVANAWDGARAVSVERGEVIATGLATTNAARLEAGMPLQLVPYDQMPGVIRARVVGADGRILAPEASQGQVAVLEGNWLQAPIEVRGQTSGYAAIEYDPDVSVRASWSPLWQAAAALGVTLMGALLLLVVGWWLIIRPWTQLAAQLERPGRVQPPASFGPIEQIVQWINRQRE